MLPRITGPSRPLVGGIPLTLGKRFEEAEAEAEALEEWSEHYPLLGAHLQPRPSTTEPKATPRAGKSFPKVGEKKPQSPPKTAMTPAATRKSLYAANKKPQPAPIKATEEQLLVKSRLKQANKNAIIASVPLQYQRQRWWFPESGVIEAADEFEKDFQQRCVEARTTFKELGATHGSDERAIKQFDKSLAMLRRLRYQVQPVRFGKPTPMQTTGGIHDLPDVQLVGQKSGPWAEVDGEEPDTSKGAVQRARRIRWRVSKSIWTPRQNIGNSKSFFETEEAMRPTFEADWALAREAHSLRTFIVRFQKEADGLDTRQWAANNELLDEIRLIQEVDEVKEALWDQHQLIWNTFEYYCSLHANDPDTSGEYPIYLMSFNGYLSFARDTGFISKWCPARHLEIIFKTVDVDNEVTKEKLEAAGLQRDRLNRMHQLNRHEFIEALVRIAIVRYVQSKEINDVSDSVVKCLAEMARNLPKEVTQSSNHYRSRFCYTEPVDLALTKHKTTLRSLFELYAAEHTQTTAVNALQSRKMLSVGEWVKLVDDLGFVDSGNISTHDLKLIFFWSRIRSVADYSDAAQMRLRNFFFEDFLEGIVRLSLMIALPTDDEIAAIGAADAGEYIMQLRTQPDEMRAFIDERKRKWYQDPTQRVGRCIEHLCTLIARMIEKNTSGTKGDGVVTSNEAASYMRQMRRAAPEMKKQLTMMSFDGEAIIFEAARKKYKEKLLEVINLVPIFGGLTTQQCVSMRDSMTDAPFEKGDRVIQQGDNGNCFFVTYEGKCEAVREGEGPGADVTLLKEYDEFDFFGERALLKQEPRYASIIATTDLRCFKITQERFEAVCGKPLSECLPDYY